MFLKIQFLFLTLFLAATVVTAIDRGSTLSASSTSNQTWSSPSGTFSLGFISVQPPTTPPSYIAAISYTGGDPVVWSAGHGAAVDSGGSLQFLSSGNLRLVNGSGATVWESATAGATSAALEDSGNLVISNGTSTVWSSFEHPTDTLVQSQNFSVGKVLTSESYFFSLSGIGNLTLKWNNSIEYWTQGLNSSVNISLESPVLSLNTIGLLELSDVNLGSNPVLVAYSSDYDLNANVFRVLKLDNDGNLRIYSTNLGGGTSTVRWAAVANQCEVYSYCGNYGVCSYNDSSTVCGCPSENFEMVDPNNGRKGCRRKVSLDSCQGSATMLTLDHAVVLSYPPTSETFFIGLSACRTNCLSGSSACFASTSLSDGSGQCVLRSIDFVSGYQDPSLPSTSYFKVCPPLAPNPPSSSAGTVRERRSKVPAWVVVVVVLGTLLVLLALEGGLWMWCCRNNKRFSGLSAQYALLEYASGAPVQFSYRELQQATKGFKEKLGAGGFGAVYRGTLVNKTVVAVKQLEGIEQGEKQFRMEVATISSTHHLNLVRLIGFCSEGRHRLLVYEFMKNGSLDNFLFLTEQHSGKLLNWEYRYNIALGTARGITYLHEECRDCIVHCDIKPENILLDENYVSKVSDFGLAKLINPKDHRHRTLTSVRGTRGYLAPEWLANLPITSKSDVYSFGMVLLEIVSGRRNFDVSDETNRKKFSIWAYEEFERGNISGILDKRLAAHEVDMEQVRRAIQASFWCIQEQPSQRPTMSRVLQMLEGVTEVEKPPAPKSVIEGTVSGTSTYLSSNASAFSTVGVSPPGPSSASSFQISGVSTFNSGRTPEKATSSLLQSDT
ncbi:G-type lectin S-receptor-like serine/threonine-protein kinase At1g34300 [Vigna unguiculata]|uniref:Receptor-like serine/threonine-protein kinase n=1 Tax=Vigna unguiculata TaxID=3917 RepID=A0A4D6M1E6_VIGUN|nr:G-type lectin S-receptor-like serine/threonine-protein kinase At1g34300 [Vigna unguiculata]QCD94371.1 interleukin-1 receptor-associated kinase 4 [Vigna unguiculata]